MTLSARRVDQSVYISTFTMAGVRIRALTTPRLIKLTSTRCRSARQPNIGRRSTYQGGDSVQTTGARQPAPQIVVPLMGADLIRKR
jgi:putative transposase